MVASRQVEIPYYRAVGKQRGRGFRALAQVIGRTTIPFLRKHIVPAAERVGADLLEFAAPEYAEVVSSRKEFKTAAKSEARQTMRKQLGVVAEKDRQAESFQQNPQNKSTGCQKTFIQTILIDHIGQFLVPTFFGSFWTLCSSS